MQNATNGIKQFDATDAASRANFNTALLSADAKFDAATGHTHDGMAGNGPKITSAGLASGAATDTVIGNRTADPAQTPTGLVGTITQWFSWITNRIKAITGATNWYDAPATTLAATNTHINSRTDHVSYGVATGSANAYAVTLTPAPASLVDGLALSVKINVQNTGASTLNVSGLGAKAIKKANGNDVASANLKAGSIYTFRYNATTAAFTLQGEGGGGDAQAGDVLSGKVFTNDTGSDQVGTMPNRGAVTITPGTVSQAISDGYHNGSGYVVGDSDLIPSNIVAGKDIFGVVGSYNKIYGVGDLAPVSASVSQRVNSFYNVSMYLYGIAVSPSNGDIMLVGYSSPSYNLNVVRSDLSTTYWYGAWTNSIKPTPKYLSDGTFIVQTTYGRLTHGSASGATLQTTAGADLSSGTSAQYISVDEAGGYVYATLSDNSSSYKLRKYRISDMGVAVEVNLTAGAYACTFSAAQSAVYTCDGSSIKKYNTADLSLAWSIPVPTNYVFYDLIYDPVGNKLFSWTFNNTTSKYVLETRSAATGALIASITPYGQSNWYPWVVDAYGYLWINDTNGVTRYKNDGTYASYTNKSSGSYQTVYGIAWNPTTKSIDCACYTSSTGSDDFFRIGCYNTIA